VTTPLDVPTARARLRTRLAVAPRPVGATEFVHVSNAAMRAASVVGHRRAGERAPFTGWEVVAVGEALDPAAFGYYTVSELAEARPSWLAALELPDGWSFRFVDDTLVDCVSPAGETVPIGLRVRG
jgi:hypothetical protein